MKLSGPSKQKTILTGRGTKPTSRIRVITETEQQTGYHRAGRIQKQKQTSKVRTRRAINTANCLVIAFNASKLIQSWEDVQGHR